MGRITEALKYLNADPKNINEVQKDFSHLTVTPELKELRKELKLYQDKKKRK